MLGKIRGVHLIGIGGSGMCGIAEVLMNRGFAVSGSDMAENAAVKRLRSLGARIAIGHSAENLGEAQVVVVSSAIAERNPEIQVARARQIPVIPRAEMLTELMRQKTGIAVAGAHGKTTTTSFVLAVLAAGGLDPTAVIGGKVNAIGSNVKLGQGEWFIAEADESDGSFLRLTPMLCVVTNVDREHLNHYGSMDHIRQAFVDFANRVPFYGAAIVCLDDAETEALIPRIRRRIVTYGLREDAHVRGKILEKKAGTTRISVSRGADLLGELTVRVPGVHNVQNALAAVAVGLECDVPFDAIRAGLADFSGIERRFQRKGEREGVLVLDDYAHHPKEIEATLAACKEAHADRRLVVLFQPHRFTRLRDLMEEFVQSLAAADQVFLLPVYTAGEEPIEGVTHRALAEKMASRSSKVQALEGRAEALNFLRKHVKAGDLLVTLGAGDVYKVGEEFLK